MDNAGAIERDGGATPRVPCANCGFPIASGASFCGSCGVSIAEIKLTNETADLNLLVAVATLAWVLWMLFWLAEPLAAVAVDPVASLRTTLWYSGLWTGLMLPFIALLSLAAYLNWRAGGRVRMPTLRHNQAAPGALVIFLAVLIWLFVSLLLRSEPGSEFSAGIAWLLFTGLLAVLCVAIVGPEAYKNWKALRIPRIMRMLGYLIPFPAAVAFLFVMADAPLRIRFDLSQDELTRYVDEFERTDGASMPAVQMVGLYNLGVPGRRGDCVTLTTNSDLDYYAGFAYCTGPPPAKPNVHFHHFKDRWLKFEVYH
jgi:hypothetical protein